MNKTIFDDCTEATKMNSDKIKEDYASQSRELDKKCFIAWSPLEENKFLFKQKYISCSRSVPRRNKRFTQYKINRSLNFDGNIHSSGSENSSFEEDKHLTRSAKIMRALNFNSSPSYYGKTKIKKSLNFNVTPSPKRFMPTKKSIRKTLSLNFNSPLSITNKYLNFDDNPSDSVNNSLLYSSSESIDENQNETPLQQDTKEYGILHYSTPNTKLNKRSLCSSLPSLRSQLKESIDNIVCITATPTSQFLKRIKGRADEISGTSRNLFHEFHDNSDDRPSTPENVIDIIPESTSGIKRSHKKERFSRRSERGAAAFSNDEGGLESSAKSALTRYAKHVDPLEEFRSSMDGYSSINMDLKNSPLCHSGGNMSDTGSLFDYAEEEEEEEEEESSIKESVEASNSDDVLFEEEKFDANEIKLEEGNTGSCLEIHRINENESLQEQNDIRKDVSSDLELDTKTDVRPVTPELTAEVLLESQISVTPENRVNFLQNVLKDSIKKSHKKIKDDNKKRLFSPKLFQDKFEITEQRKDVTGSEGFEQAEKVDNREEDAPIEEKHFDAPHEERACTPERVNSSRLLLSQFSSVKKSHKKDKHNKILSGFLKRQEYFNKEMDLCQSEADAVEGTNNNAGNGSSDFDTIESMKDSASPVTRSDDTPLIKSSPSKRRRSLNVSLNYENETNLSDESELQEVDTSKEEFKIFTPLKRKRSLISPIVKEYLHFYDLPSEKDEVREDDVVNIGLSRCLTPIPNFQDNYVKTSENDIVAIKLDDSISKKDLEYLEDFEGSGDSQDSTNANKHDSIDVNVNGRSTPRDMPTTALYPNVDSIKKSHKKNKRGITSRKGFNLIENDTRMEDEGETSVKSIEKESFERLNDRISIAVHDINDSNEHHAAEISSDCAGNENEERVNVPTENVPSDVTPPNCLKAKNYIRLLRDTSIKRSHKKIRDKKKRELVSDNKCRNELSDDGSIFGDDDHSIQD